MPLWSKDSKSKKAEAAKAPAEPVKAPPEPVKTKATEKATTKPPAQTAPATELSSADMQKRREVSARLLMRFGEVVSVMMRAQQFRDLPLKQLQEVVVPPLMLGQFLVRSEEHTSELQSLRHLVCRLLLEKKKH